MHKYDYLSNGGEGLGGVKIPLCSCGWQGKPVKNYDGNQLDTMLTQFNNHVKEQESCNKSQ